MKKRWIIAVLVLFLSACGPGTTPTLESTAIPSPTIVPLNAVNLDPVLLPPFPLPSGYLPGQVQPADSKFFGKLPPAQRAASVNITQSKRLAGVVTVFLYGAEADRASAYKIIVDGMGSGSQTIDGVGEQAAAKKSVIFETELVFRRCAAIADIILFEDFDLDKLAADARILEKNLQPLACR